MSSSSRSTSPSSNVRPLPLTSHRRRSTTNATDDSPLPHSPTPSNLGGSPTPSSGTSSTPGIKKRHVCPTCQKSFTTSGHLSRHARVHTGERNHKCPFPGCETRCSRQDNLQQHYRIHLSPGSRRTSGSSTRSALARAQGPDGNGVKKRGSKYAVFTPPPPPESPPSTPPPLEQAYPILSKPLDLPPPLTSSHAAVPLSIPPAHDFHSDGSSSSPDSRYESESPLVHPHSAIDRRSTSYTGSYAPVNAPSEQHPSGEYSYYTESQPVSRGTYHSQSYNGYSTSNLVPAPVPASVPSQRGPIFGSSDGEQVLLQATNTSFIPSQHYSHHPSYPASHTPSDSPSPASSHYSSYGSTQSSAGYSMHGAMNHSPLMDARGVYDSSHHGRVGYPTGARYSSPMPGVSHLHGHYSSIPPSEMV